MSKAAAAVLSGAVFARSAFVFWPTKVAIQAFLPALSTPPEIIRPDEGDFSIDKDNWLAQTIDFANNEITAYAVRLDGLYSELLAYILEDRRDDFTLSLDRFKSAGVSYIQVELNRIASLV
ncbi:MAG: hypothetical protein LBD58_11215 [Treponema sp.]|nr:hypothetical protein [Treponema sp.]